MNFTFGHRQQFEVLQVFIFQQGHPLPPTVLGTYIGNINDPDFMAKIQRIRGRLWLNNIKYHEAHGTLTNKEGKRLSDLERYNRRMSKLFNEFWRKIDSCAGLFKDNEIAAISEDYKRTVTILKQRYNQ